jgi:hypothetical protein
VTFNKDPLSQSTSVTCLLVNSVGVVTCAECVLLLACGCKTVSMNVQ